MALPERLDVPALVERVRRGEPRAVGRLLSLVESGGDADRLRAIAASLAPYGGSAHVVGLTGAPGVGKSTITAALVTALRARGDRVGVLAIDPSSPFSGGALLGDRVRMIGHETDDGVFIRSMAARGQLGGLAAAAPPALRVLDAAGCDIVLLETVGVGQSEIDVARLADTTVVLLAPGGGDGVQAAKAGILEVADVLVVNKADQDAAARTVRDLTQVMSADGNGGWSPPVLRTVATRGTGIDALLATVDRHRTWADVSGARAARRLARAEAEITAITLERLLARIGDLREHAGLPALAARLVAGELDPYAAADALEPALTAPLPSRSTG